VKVFYADCSLDAASKREEIDLAEAGAPNHEMIKKHYLFEIVQARTEEILRKINQELHAIKRIGLLPAGVRFKQGFGGDLVQFPGTFDYVTKQGYYFIYKLFRGFGKFI
jgi:cell division ATPase FtsA